MRDVLEQFLTVQPRAAVACLRAIGPAPWEVIAGGRLRMFGEKQLDAMAKWISHAASQQVGVYAGLPIRDGQTRHISIRTPRTVRPSGLRPAPSLIVTAEQHWMVWTLNEPVPLAEARRLALGLARRCGGVPSIGEAIPLPGSIRYAQTGVGLRARHNVTLLPPIEHAYRLVGGELAEVTVAAPDLPRFDVASDIKPEAIAWAWPNVIPLGSFSIIMGEPGVGKSGIAVDIAARISAGAPWPTGGNAERGGAIILESEDDARSVTIPRLLAAGADMRRVMVHGEPVDLTQQLGMLEREAKRLGNVRALVLSPLRMYFGDESGRQVDTRQRLQPLLAWAAANRVAVIGVGHKVSGKAGSSGDRVIQRTAPLPG